MTVKESSRSCVRGFPCLPRSALCQRRCHDGELGSDGSPGAFPHREVSLRWRVRHVVARSNGRKNGRDDILGFSQTPTDTESLQSLLESPPPLPFTAESKRCRRSVSVRSSSRHSSKLSVQPRTAWASLLSARTRHVAGRRHDRHGEAAAVDRQTGQEMRPALPCMPAVSVLLLVGAPARLAPPRLMKMVARMGYHLAKAPSPPPKT